MQIRRVEIFVGILFAVITTATAGLRCYSCSSYMNQCKEVVSRSPSHVGRNKCSTKCFVRTGEDGATYRGCFDDFSRVVHLQANYIGCRNQTWNNRSLRWCFCSTELCNGAGMDTLETMTESVPAAAKIEEQPVLPTHTITTPPATLNTDHGVFKYIEGEDKEVVEEEEEAYGSVITSRPASAGGPTKTRLRSNAVPTKSKLNRAALKQLNGDEYYERIDKPIEEVFGSARTAVEQSPHGGLRHGGINIADKEVRPSGPQRAIVVQKPNEDIFDREYELNDLDYPYNQDMRSISRIVEKLSKVENAHQFGQGSFRSSGDDDKVLSIRKGANGPKLNQSPDRHVGLQQKSAKVRSHYEEPLPFKSYVSAELASKMTCEESGYYQHPTDCTLYMACVYDPYTRSPIWHLMRCPELLFWDNERKICVEFSINCAKVEGADKLPLHKFV